MFDISLKNSDGYASGQQHLLPEYLEHTCSLSVCSTMTLIQMMIIKPKVIIRQKLWYVSHVCTFTFHFYALEKEMATHSGVLAWRIPGTAEPGGLPSVGSHRVRHN